MAKRQFERAEEWLYKAEQLVDAATAITGKDKEIRNKRSFFIPNYDTNTGEKLTPADKIRFIQQNHPEIQIPNFNPCTGGALDTAKKTTRLCKVTT